MIYQNAVFIKSTGKFYISRNVHDFVSFKTKNGEGFIDGGKEYLRSSVISQDDDIEDYCLAEGDSFDEICLRLLWGTYGITGKDPLKYVPIASLEKQHLAAILRNTPLLAPKHREVVAYWFAKKSE